MANKGKMSAAGIAPGNGISGKVTANIGKRYMAAIGKPDKNAVLHHQVTCANGKQRPSSRG